MVYVCLPRQEFFLGEYSLVPIRYEDIFLIRIWRNEQIDVLRQKKPLSHEDQENYWNQTIAPSFSEKEPAQLLFSFLYQNKCIGYGGLVHIDWDFKRAEVSFLVETARYQDKELYQKECTCFFTLIKHVAFETLHLHRLSTETFAIRPHHIAIMESLGFLFEGRLKDHVIIKGNYVDAFLHGCVRREAF